MALDAIVFGPWIEGEVHTLPSAAYAGNLTDIVFEDGNHATDDIPTASFTGSLTDIVYTEGNHDTDQTGFVMHVNPRFLCPAINPMLAIRPL